MAWENQVYVDGALPFGLHSAPKIFNVVVEALLWGWKANGAWHYMDDFITIGRPGSGECTFNCELLHHLCNKLGVPLAEEKSEGPATAITFLGIEIDSVAMELRLPQEKLNRVQEELEHWQVKKRCTKQELRSLLGLLKHAATVVRPGRTFLRHLYDLLASVKANRHHIYLNTAACSDLAWWFTFLGSWNGVSILRTQQSALIHHTVVSDASGQWGCGAYSDRRWFQLCWSGSSVQEESIMVKELIPIVIAAAVWGKHWTGHTVQCKCDNDSVVAVIASRTSKNTAVMHLLRCLFFFEASLNFCITATHLPGAQNELADDLSRDRLSDFLQKAPSMQPGPCRIPQELRELLFTPLDWTLPSWRLQFSTILRTA